MVNKGAVGQTGEAFEMLVERGKEREFARATKSQNPEYLDDPVPVQQRSLSSLSGKFPHRRKSPWPSCPAIFANGPFA